MVLIKLEGFIPVKRLIWRLMSEYMIGSAQWNIFEGAVKSFCGLLIFFARCNCSKDTFPVTTIMWKEKLLKLIFRRFNCSQNAYSLLRILLISLSILGLEWVFVAKMSLFLHLSRSCLWMLRIAMLMGIINWLWLSNCGNHFPICGIVQNRSYKTLKACRSGQVGWVAQV